MRGITGAAHGDYGVVFSANISGILSFGNGEFICRRVLYPTEAVGWYDLADLRRANAR